MINCEIFFGKLKNRLYSEKNKLWRYLPIENISKKGMKEICSKDDFVNKLLLILGDFRSIYQLAISKDERRAIIHEADFALNHEFDLLGSGRMRIDPINWHLDFKSGFKWNNNLFYLDQRSLSNSNKGVDIKVPWELNRCHHILWLSEAYCLTNDEKYAKEVVFEIENWIDENPVMHTVNWVCSMDVAIRAVNWMYALLLIANSDSFSNDFSRKVYSSLYQHGFFIYNNLEKNIPYSNNHYTSNLIGLLYLGKLFNNTKRGQQWFRFAKKEYYKETLIQILPSGVNYEKSVSYHRLMAELLVYPYYMLRRDGEDIPNDVKSRLDAMLNYVALYTPNSGLSPIIADNDNGRFLPFVPRDFRDHRYLLNKESLESSVVGFGVTPLKKPDEIKKSICFIDANVAILRKEESYLFVSCCPRGRFDKDTNNFIGTHLHNDLLSFVYSVGNKEIIVDPGAYCYTSDIEKRIEFRATNKHNTILVDGEEQNFLGKNNAFATKYNCYVKPLSVVCVDGLERCIGEYATIEGKMTHNRIFELSDNLLVIRDNIKKIGPCHTAQIFFHFAPNIEPTLEGNTALFSIGDSSFEITINFDDSLKLALISDTISPAYGVLEEAKTLVVEVLFKDCTELITTIKQKNH